MKEQISFQDFCKMESIAYCSKQLRGNKRKHIKTPHITSTKQSYLYKLWNFHYWLMGKGFYYDEWLMVGKSTFQRQSKTVTLDGLEHFLRLYESSHTNSKQHFTQLIKKYLKDPIHAGKKQQTLKIDYYAIKAYFKRNDYPINFHFRPNHTDNPDIEEPELLTLGKLMNMLTIGQPTLLQKAVFLCKFHRGLDTSTFVDRFNFESWDQIVKIFGTDNWDQWDLKKCPIPIKLVRIKTDVVHVGFLDIDAIVALQEYLNYRQTVQQGNFKPSPIFLNSKNMPITEEWIRSSFRSLAKKSGLIKQNDKTKGQHINPNSLRILLKSTLIVCNVNKNVAEEAIGHKTPDRLGKHQEKDLKKMQNEHSKSSGTINIFCKVYKMINEIDVKT